MDVLAFQGSEDLCGGGAKPAVGRADAERAVATLLAYLGEDGGRDGLADTPARVIRAFDEYFAGYGVDPVALLERTFEETAGYDEIVLLRDVPFHSHCEHHLAPFLGRANLAYLPARRVVGISKLARVVDALSRRLQIQERLTVAIADAIEAGLKPRGVAVMLEGEHFCMSARGVAKPGTTMRTSRLTGLFRTDAALRAEVLSLMGR